MDVRFFKEFLVLAETKNFWEASRRLYIGQSTLSKHIQNMEREFDAQLFLRTSRSVELTSFGELLLPYAQSICGSMDGYLEALAGHKRDLLQILNIGTIPSTSQSDITQKILDFRGKNPGLTVNILEGDSLEVEKWLFSRKCEIAFLREYPSAPVEASPDRNRESFPLCKSLFSTDYLTAVLPARHPLAGREALSLSQLSEETFCFLKQGTLIWQICCQACEAAGFTPRVIFDSHHLAGIRNMVLANGSVALLTSGQVCSAGFMQDQRLSIVKIMPPIVSQVFLCYPQDASLSAAARQFVQYFHSELP